MATPRSNIVRLRLTDLEKQDWTRASGGARKMSEWIRSVCNAECAATREPLPLHVPPIPNAKPVIVGDAIAREVLAPGEAPAERESRSGQEDQAHRESRSLPATGDTGDDSKVEARTASTGSGESCPRWMHHRPGVYCGACKRVIGNRLS